MRVHSRAGTYGKDKATELADVAADRLVAPVPLEQQPVHFLECVNVLLLDPFQLEPKRNIMSAWAIFRIRFS
jgi:hypothetical protein